MNDNKTIKEISLADRVREKEAPSIYSTDCLPECMKCRQSQLIFNAVNGMAPDCMHALFKFQPEQHGKM